MASEPSNGQWEVKVSQTKQTIYFYNSEAKISCWTPPNGYTKDEALKLNGADGHEKEIEKLFEKKEDQVRASHILVKHNESRRPSSWKAANITRTKDEAMEILGDYQKEIEAVDDEEKRQQKFAELATKNSDCSSHSNGGDLGWFGRGQMQAAFEEATYGLEVGAVSDIVSTDSGVHLIFRTG